MSDEKKMMGGNAAKSRAKFFMSRQKKKNATQNLDNQNDEWNSEFDFDEFNTNHDQIIDKEVPSNSFEGEMPVGAFPILGILGGVDDCEEMSIPERAQQTQNQALLTITNARLVSNDEPQQIPQVDAFPLEESTNGKFWNSKYWLVAIVLLILLVGLISGFIISARSSSKDAMYSLEAIAVLNNLKKLLTAASLLELESADSAQSKAVRWLLEESNFKDYSSNRQVQRFAMAALYFSTNGKNWTRHDDWLTNSDECSWFQNFTKDRCNNGALQQLSLPSNNLIGSLPNDIFLLDSLKYLDLYDNSLTGIIPTEVGVLNNLEGLFLSYNFLTRNIPSEIGQCTKLSTLSFYSNQLLGIVPREIGLLKNLNYLNIRENYFLNGTVPEAICTKGAEVFADCIVECCCCQKDFCLNSSEIQNSMCQS